MVDLPVLVSWLTERQTGCVKESCSLLSNYQDKFNKYTNKQLVWHEPLTHLNPSLQNQTLVYYFCMFKHCHQTTRHPMTSAIVWAWMTCSRSLQSTRQPSRAKLQPKHVTSKCSNLPWNSGVMSPNQPQKEDSTPGSNTLKGQRLQLVCKLYVSI